MEKQLDEAHAAVSNCLGPGATAQYPDWFIFNSPPEASTVYDQFILATRSVNWTLEANRGRPLALALQCPSDAYAQSDVHGQNAVKEEESDTPVLDGYEQHYTAATASNTSVQGIPGSMADDMHALGQAQKRYRAETEVKQEEDTMDLQAKRLKRDESETQMKGEKKGSLLDWIRSLFS